MRNYVMALLVMVVGLNLVGCKKKQLAQEEMQEPLSITSLSTINADGNLKSQGISGTTGTTETAMTEPVLAPVSTNSLPLAVESKPEIKSEMLPPQGPYKPTTSQIQTCLTNAGLYSGKIDGKSGPMTKKAIEEFQKANNLKVDGKVGPQTWEILSKHLNAAPVAAEAVVKGKNKKR